MQTQVLHLRDLPYLVTYEVQEGQVTFHGVQMLDKQGDALVPVGPDLTNSFNTLYVVHEDGSGETVLSLLAGDIDCLTCKPPSQRSN